MQSYAEMKSADSVGNEAHGWVGPLPSGWSIRRLGTLGELVKGRGGSKEDNRDTGVPVVRYGDLYTKIDTVITCAPAFVDAENAAKYSPLPSGSLLFAASGESAEDIGKSALVLLDEPAVTGGDTVIFHPGDQVDPLYLAYVLESAPLRANKALRGTGFTVVHISAGRLKTLPIPLPPQWNQRAIAEYLDRETARIDTLIEEQQRLIEMLRERRQAVVDHEISARKGVPLVSLRGLVVAPITAGADETSDTSNPSWWPRFVRTTDIASLTRLDPEKRVTADPKSTGDAMLARNDLVATRAGATIGKAYIHLSDEPASYAGYLVRIRPNPARVVPMYLAYWSQSRHYLDQVAVGAVKSTIENYSASKYRATRVPVPTLDEQQRVVAHLDEQTAKIDKLIDETERFIELSRERRAALITAAVTGQTDVREVA